MSWRSPSTNAGEAAGDAHDGTPRSPLNVEQQMGASATPFQVPTSPGAQQKPKIESSLFTRELWLSASHILREFAPLQHLATRKEDEEANDDDSDEEDGSGQGRSSGFEGEHKKLLLVMVGLPARGKSFIAHRLTNYLTWYGLRTRVFNVGAYRRAVGGNEDAEFFDASNKDAAATREQLAWTVFAELMLWLVSGRGDVGIFDATNTTDERRRQILEKAMAQCPEIKVLFIESICDDPAVLEDNLKHKVKSSPDFAGVAADLAKAEFMARIRKYEQVYKTINDDLMSYIKVINLSSKVVCNQIHGRTQHRILAFLMSLHVIERPVWLVRPGPVDVDPSVYMGSCHPGVVAHQLKSPKVIPTDIRHQADARSNSNSFRDISRRRSTSVMHSPTGASSPLTGLTPSTSFSSLGNHSPPQPSSPSSVCAAQPRQLADKEAGTSASMPIEPPEMILSEDEDDYWGSFKGTATWQRKEFKKHVANDLLAEAGAAGAGTDTAQYSWPLPMSAGKPPPGTSWGSDNGAKGRDDSHAIYDLVIPHPSADGASLNEEGRHMAEQLGVFIQNKCEESGWTQKPYIFTSTLPRAVETATICAEQCSSNTRVESVSALNPVDVGACHGMTLGEIRQMLGQEQLVKMRKHPGTARLPGGESQFDVTKRLEPFIVDYLERQRSPVVVVSHLSTLQILYEYFLGSGADTKGRAFWALSMPVGTVIQLTARFGGASAGVSWQETRFQL
mmetsp:Transcript_83290/g.135041  ORF Transcript_83290/g.135041 Transcript_83290/m.135041 type:complete len:732 (+) Transcript_83290:199-2394(+)